MTVIDPRIHERVCRVVDFLSQFGRIRAAYLFGSQANGTADADSDIDIAIFIDGAENWGIDRRAQIATDTQLKLGDDLELHFFSGKAADSAEPGSFAAYVKCNGVRVADLFNSRWE